MFKQLFFVALFATAQAGILSWIPGVHECQQGHKCVYYRGGSMLSYTNQPGYHFKMPFITSHQDIQITWQTDKLINVICGSSRGGKAYLDIEVVNKLHHTDECILKTVGEHTIDYDKPLIFDYIPSEVAQFCKNYTLDDIVIREFDKLDEVLLEKLQYNVKSYGLDDCLSIKKVRIARPKLDDRMRAKFEEIELEEKQKALVLQQKETEKIRLDAQLQRVMMEKDREQKTNEVEMNIQHMKVKADSERQSVINEMEFDMKTRQADAEMYRLEKLAEGNELLFSNPNYVRLEGYKAAHNNAKLIIGDVPQNALINLGDLSQTVQKYAYDSFNHTSY